MEAASTKAREEAREGRRAPVPLPATSSVRETKRCYDCKKTLPVEDFHRGQRRCKQCNYAQVKAWRERYPEKYKDQQRKRSKLRSKHREERNATEATDRARQAHPEP